MIANKNIARLLALVMVLSSILLVPSNVYATGETVKSDTGVVYVQYTSEKKAEIEAHFVDNTAPTYSGEEECGYLFGGWFEKTKESTFQPIKNETALASAANYYAKFVPAYVLSVKCQNLYRLNAQDAKTSLRFVSGLDSTNYAEFGFIVHAVVLDSTTMDFTRAVKVGETIGQHKLDTVYEKLLVYESNPDDSENPIAKKYKPQNVLGTAAEYFMGYRINDVKLKNYDKPYAIQPYWVTFDGAKVMGLTKYAHIEDGLNGYINIPINLKSTEDVAAGRVDFDWSDLAEQGYDFMEAECGMVLPMKVAQEDGNNVRCVATVAGTDANNPLENKESDNIYMNLRFKPTSTTNAKKYDGSFYRFAISGTEFGNLDETIVDGYKVWNVQY